MYTPRAISVPSGVPITPNQAFVDAQVKQSANVGSNGIDFSNSGIVTIDRTYLAQLSALNTVSSHAANLSGNNVQDPTQIDDILGAFVDADVSDASIDISGANMAAPPSGLHADEIYTLTMPDSPVGDTGSGSVYFAINAATPYYVEFRTDLNLSASNQGFTTSVIFYIGIQDSPTAEQMATKLASLLSLFGSITAIASAKTVQATDPTDANYPYSSLSDNGSGIAGVQNQAGVAAGGNANKATLLSNGNTVTTS